MATVSVPVFAGSVLAAGVLGFLAFPVLGMRLIGAGRERTRSLTPDTPPPQTTAGRLKF